MLMRLLVRNEWRATVRDGRLVVFALSLLVLLLGALFKAVSSERARAEERRSVEHETRTQWDAQGIKNPHRGAHYGLYAFRPASALAAVEPGLLTELGQAVWLEPHRRNMTRYSPAADAPPDTRLGGVIPSFVLIVLIPLLLIGVTHHAVSQEREWGTLRMMHGLGMSGPRLLFSKWIGSMSAFAVLLLPAVLVAAYLLLGGAGGERFDRDSIARFALMLAVLGAYYASVGALTIAMSSRFSTSRVAWLCALASWVLLVLVVPRAGAAAADRLISLPTGGEFWAAIASDIEHGLPGDGNAAARLKAFDAQLLRANAVERVEELPMSITARRRLFRDGYAAKVHAVHFSVLWDRFERQEQLIRSTGFLSPTAPLRQVLMALAGSGLHEQRHFEEAAERYRDEFTRAIDEWDARATRGIGNYEAKYAGNDVWSAIPPFTFTPTTLPDVLGRITPDLAFVGGWLILALALLLLAGRSLAP
jgi:ABC-2 type transport system permease protein